MRLTVARLVARLIRLMVRGPVSRSIDSMTAEILVLTCVVLADREARFGFAWAASEA
jgi:hypothetical protein